MIKILKGKLSPEERCRIIEDTKKFEYLIFIGPKTRDNFDTQYKIYYENEFVGCCAVNFFGNYAKIGPLAILSTFQGEGLGKALVKHIVDDLKKTHHIYLGSSNPAVWSIAEGLGFQKINSSFFLPIPIYFIYLKLSLRVLVVGESIIALKELARKRKVFEKRSRLLHFMLVRR